MLSVRRSLSTSSPALSAVKAGMILSRNPIVTADMTPMEAAYYKYQSQLEKRLMWTFPQYFYFKKGTLSERRFVEAQRGPVTKQPGVYYPKGVPDVKHNRERREKQEIVIPKENKEEGSTDDDVSRPVELQSRVTEADKKGDLTSLERKLSKTLYLVVKDNQSWGFPTFDAPSDTPLHVSAEAGLRKLGGENINTWTVSNKPVAVVGSQYLIKSHILNGEFKGQEHMWLAKEELEQFIGKEYYEKVEHLFV